MAQYVMTRLVDDIDGSHAVKTLSFSLDGHSYEIDLSESHLSAFQQAVAPFVTAARVVPSARASAVSNGRRPVRAPAPEPAAPASNGRTVPARDVTVAEDATVSEPVTARPAALDPAPFGQPTASRESDARPARSKPAPLVANPFSPRS